MFYSDATATMPTHVVIRPLVKLVGDCIYHSNGHIYKVVALEGDYPSCILLSNFTKISLTGWLNVLDTYCSYRSLCYRGMGCVHLFACTCSG